MNRCAATLACALALPPAGVQAQTLPSGPSLGPGVSTEIVVAGFAPQACLLSPPIQTAVANAILTAGANAAEIRLTQFVDAQTAVPNPATIDLEFPVICNGAHRLIVRTARGALTLAAPAPAPGPGFANRHTYQVSALWGGQRVTGQSDAANPVDISTPDGAAGILSLSIQIPGGGAPLVAGPYTDSLIVELQPAN